MFEINQKVRSFNVELENDRCVLTFQSPFTLFCYWQLSEWRKNLLQHHFNKEFHLFELKIRLIEVTEPSERYIEKIIPYRCSWWFFYQLNGNKTYYVEVGVYTEEGSFFTILRSNQVVTPFFDEQKEEKVTDWCKPIKLNVNQNWLDQFSTYSYYEKENKEREN